MRNISSHRRRSSRRDACLFVFAAMLALGVSGSSRAAPTAGDRPQVRTVPAFIALDPAHYQAQIAETLASLKKIKAAYEKAGFEVQTLRITTQPFPEYTRNLSNEQALAFFQKYDALAAKDGFDASIGAAMLRAGDSPREARLLARVIASTKILEGSVVIAADDGIHWDAIPAAASVIHYLADNSPNSLGNFRFAAIAMVPPNTPSYPASYQMNGNHTFAVGLESANVVAAALASTSDPQKAQKAIEDSLGKWAQEIEAIGKRAAQGNFHRRGHREFHTRTARLERHAHRRGDHHARAKRYSSHAHRLFRVDAARARGFRDCPSMERGPPLAQFPAS